MFNESPTNVTTSSDRYAHCTVDTSSLTRARTISLTHSTASAVNGYATLAHPSPPAARRGYPLRARRRGHVHRHPRPLQHRAHALSSLFPPALFSPRPRDAVIRRRRRRTLRDGTHQPIPPPSRLLPVAGVREPRPALRRRRRRRRVGVRSQKLERGILRPLEPPAVYPPNRSKPPGDDGDAAAAAARRPPDGAYGREALHRRALSSHHLHALDRVAGTTHR